MNVFWDRYMNVVPPGFEGEPFAYMLTLFSLIMICLLSLEWIWRIFWGIKEQPFPIKHPVTVLRIILLLTGFSILMRVGPDVLRYAMWKDLSSGGRLLAYRADHYMDMFSFFPFSIAWLVGYLTMDLLHYQLDKRPIPMHLWPTWSQMKRPMKIGAAVLVISAAITFAG